MKVRDVLDTFERAMSVSVERAGQDIVSTVETLADSGMPIKDAFFNVVAAIAYVDGVGIHELSPEDVVNAYVERGNADRAEAVRKAHAHFNVKRLFG